MPLKDPGSGEPPKKNYPKPIAVARPEYPSNIRSVDKNNITELRKWSRDYFSNNLIYENKDFQTLAQVRDTGDSAGY